MTMGGMKAGGMTGHTAMGGMMMGDVATHGVLVRWPGLRRAMTVGGMTMGGMTGHMMMGGEPAMTT